MGTSSHNIGQSGHTPLVPSWLEEENSNIPAPGAGDRFSNARGDMTRFINSGGTNTRQARSGISDYVRHSLGGSSNAVRRMGSANRSAARLLGAYGAFSSVGVQGFERFFSLEGVSDRPITEVFTRLTDTICEDGGLIDGAIFRSAYIDALEDNQDIAGKTISEMTPEIFLSIIKSAMAKAVVGRITNDVANKVILLPDDKEKANSLLEFMDDFVAGGISDGFAKAHMDINRLTERETISLVERVYKSTFQFLEAAGDDL